MFRVILCSFLFLLSNLSFAFSQVPDQPTNLRLKGAPRPNSAPNADAGADQVFLDSDGNGSETVSLNGSLSSDSDGSIISYVWREGAVQIATDVSPTVSLALGRHVIRLTVTDNKGDTSVDEVIIQVVTPGVPNPFGPLAGKPSAAGAHVANLAAMANNTWLDIGLPAPDPVHGQARARSWGGRAFVLAPNLRGAFFTGEGIHAYVKPEGLAMDDIWFYDINQHSWHAVYPGTDVNNFSAAVTAGDIYIDSNAQVATTSGGLMPIHLLIHAWDFLTYDTVRGRFIIESGSGMGRFFLGGEDDMEPGLTTLEAARDAINPKPPMSPWFYDPTTHHFTRDVATNSNTTNDFSHFSTFYYIPSLDKIFYGGLAGVTFYNLSNNTWESVSDSGSRPPSYDHGATYDSRRNRLYMGPGSVTDSSNDGLYIYDIATATWSRPNSGGPSGFGTNGNSIMYDEVNDVVTVFAYTSGLHYTYFPATNTWTSQALPSALTTGRSKSAFFDPQTNTYFVFLGLDSFLGEEMWAYRYRN